MRKKICIICNNPYVAFLGMLALLILFISSVPFIDSFVSKHHRCVETFGEK